LIERELKYENDFYSVVFCCFEKVEELERELNFINTKNASTELTQDDEEIISPNMKRQRIS